MVAYIDIDRLDSDIEIGHKARCFEIRDRDDVQSSRISQQEHITGESCFDRKVRRLCATGGKTVSVQREAAQLGERRRSDAYGRQSEIRSPVMRGDKRALSVGSQENVGLAAAAIEGCDDAA